MPKLTENIEEIEALYQKHANTFPVNTEGMWEAFESMLPANTGATNTSSKWKAWFPWSFSLLLLLLSIAIMIWVFYPSSSSSRNEPIQRILPDRSMPKTTPKASQAVPSGKNNTSPSENKNTPPTLSSSTKNANPDPSNAFPPSDLENITTPSTEINSLPINSDKNIMPENKTIKRDSVASDDLKDHYKGKGNRNKLFKD